MLCFIAAYSGIGNYNGINRRCGDNKCRQRSARFRRKAKKMENNGSGGKDEADEKESLVN